MLHRGVKVLQPYLWSDIPSFALYAVTEMSWHSLWGNSTGVPRKWGPLGAIFKTAYNENHRRKTSRIEGNLNLEFQSSQSVTGWLRKHARLLCQNQMSDKVKLIYYYKEKNIKLTRDWLLQKCRLEDWGPIYRWVRRKDHNSKAVDH